MSKEKIYNRLVKNSDISSDIAGYIIQEHYDMP